MGRYDIVGPLAAGGMAEILLARVVGPSGFQRPVVIKRILPHLARQKGFVDMFLDEARIIAGIRHTNVVQVHELGHEGEDLFLAMEYLEGESTAALMRRLRMREEKLPVALAAYIAAEAAAGLHAAHELTDAQGKRLNVVHRDVTPHNVFLGYDGGVTLLDFGIALAADKIARTDVGQFKGKLEYASPEQCRGAELDRRTDIFALGAILWELVTGMRLFKRATQMEMMRAVVELPIPTPESVVSDLDPELASVIKRALSKRRRERYQTALELRRDLLRVVHKLAPGVAIEEDLGLVMTRLFQDRLDTKKEMLRLVQAGTAVKELPDAEPDADVEIPIAVTVEYSSVPPGEGTDTGSDGIPNDALSRLSDPLLQATERQSEPPTMQRAPEDEPPTIQRAPSDPTVEASAPAAKPEPPRPQPPRPLGWKPFTLRTSATKANDEAKKEEEKKEEEEKEEKKAEKEHELERPMTHTEPLGFAPKPVEAIAAETKPIESTAAWASPPVAEPTPGEPALRSPKLTEPLGAMAKSGGSEPPSSRPVTTTDPLVTPAAAEPPPDEPPTEEKPPPVLRSRGLLVAMAVSALVAVVAVTLAMRRFGEPAAEANPSPSSSRSAVAAIAPSASARDEVPPPPSASAEPAASEIASADPVPATSSSADEADEAIVHVESTPPKAIVLVDGTKRGLTPVDVHLAKSKKQVTIELHRPGYQPIKQRVVPDMNQKLILTMVVQPGGAPATSASGKRRFGRFD